MEWEGQTRCSTCLVKVPFNFSTGRISMQNYIQWATKTPEVIQFYESLTAIKHKHRPKDDAPAE